MRFQTESEIESIQEKVSLQTRTYFMGKNWENRICQGITNALNLSADEKQQQMLSPGVDQNSSCGNLIGNTID